MVLSAVFQAAVPLAVLAVFALLVIPQPTLPRLAGAFILGSGLVTAIWVWLVWRSERPRVRLGAVIPILRDCLHYGISGLMWNTYLRMGTLVLTFFSVVEQVALFAAAFKLIDLFFKIAVLGNRVVAPQLYADSHHSPANFAKVSEVTLRLTVVASTVGALVLYLSGTWMVTLVYGAGFAASGGILSVLGVSLMLKTVALTAQTIISAADDHTQRVRVITSMTVIAFAVAVPCALNWGAIGVAYAVMSNDIVLTTLLLWRVRRTICIDNLRSVLLIPLLSAVVCALAASQYDAHALLQTLGALFLFAVVLWSSGYVRPGELAAIGNTVSSQKKR
jgi:O-antigen/teichoic acid export membrane protein